MTERHDHATTYALLKVIADAVKDAKAVVDCEIRDSWHPGDRNTAALPGGRVVGAVTLAKGRAKAEIADEQVFEAWVAQVHPEQIETVTRVKPDYVSRVKSAARQLGHTVDPETGDAIAGLSVSTGDPYPFVKLTPDAAELVARAWRSGALAELLGALLPAIEVGPESGDR